MTVLVVVEDLQLGELLLDALSDAGHTCELAAGDIATLLRDRVFDAAIVDLDTRAHDGATTIELLRRCAPGTTVLALLPCGGMPVGGQPISYHLSFEKPARLRSVLAALASRN